MKKATIGLLAAVLAGCGGDGSGEPVDAGADGAAPDAARDASADGGDAGLGERTRDVRVVRAESSDSGHTVRVHLLTCTARPIGEGCTLDSCAPLDSASDFGELTVTGSNAEVRLSPDADGVYGSTSGSGPLWMEGTEVRFRGAGAELPGFDETLTGPGEITIESPSSDVVLPDDAPLEVQWSGTEVGTVGIVFAWGSDGGSQLRCLRPAADGIMTLSETVLSQVEESGMLYFFSETRRVLTLDPDDEVRLAARAGPPSSVSYTVR